MEIRRRPPLVGYNHNVRHGERLFHVQTEDCGIDHPYVVTHVFLHGAILSSARTGYDVSMGDGEVLRLMQEQHKLALRAVRCGALDGQAPAPAATAEDEAPADEPVVGPEETVREVAPVGNLDTLDSFLTMAELDPGLARAVVHVTEASTGPTGSGVVEEMEELVLEMMAEPSYEDEAPPEPLLCPPEPPPSMRSPLPMMAGPSQWVTQLGRTYYGMMGGVVIRSNRSISVDGEAAQGAAPVPVEPHMEETRAHPITSLMEPLRRPRRHSRPRGVDPSYTRPTAEGVRLQPSYANSKATLEHIPGVAREDGKERKTDLDQFVLEYLAEDRK